MSRDITAIPPVAADRRVRYGEAPAQFYDLFLPKHEPVRGLAVMIHGGFWRARYDLTHASHLCAALARGGMAVANVEYRRVGESGGGWPGTFQDVLSFFDAAVAEFPGPVVVLGHSAGGHLALRLAVDRNLNGIVALAPVADLNLAFQLNLSNGAVVEFLGGSPTEVPEEYNDADPIWHSSEVRRELLHGRLDDTVPIELSEAFVDARKSDPGHVGFKALDDANHYDVIDPESQVWPVVLQSVRDLMR